MNQIVIPEQGVDLVCPRAGHAIVRKPVSAHFR